MIHPATELRLVDAETGQGVFATAAIPRGTVVWAHDELDQILTPARVARNMPTSEVISINSTTRGLVSSR